MVRQGNLPCRWQPAPPKTKTSGLFTHPPALKVSFWGFPQTPVYGPDTGGILKKCVNGQAVYPLSEQDGLKAQERRYTAYGKEKH